MSILVGLCIGEDVNIGTWKLWFCSCGLALVLFPLIRVLRLKCVPAPLRAIAKPPVVFQGLMKA
ncbi:MAG: hypothetical protein U1F87_06105 [Kiritimatiellia bacterium]